MFLIKEFLHLKIQLGDIISATDNFGPSKIIGRGGFGTVYKGEISNLEGRRTVAFKRLDRKFGQGNTEFWKEITMLSKLKHENLISLLHFCMEGDESVLVYEYASRGSLDRYLSDASLTWIQRLVICIEAAHAICYLHDPKETHQRVLHRDIKSSNVLLDENWTAKVSDFGLSKFGLANQPQTYLVSNPVGTIGYCDPLYHETGLLSKESDVYSFGVVLFEVMCGKLCCEYRNNQLARVLVRSWKESFVEKRVDDIVFDALKGQIDEDCLKTFSTIAYRCLNIDHKKRPTMVEIVCELEIAFKRQLNPGSISIHEQVKSKKRGHSVDNSDSIKWERLSKSKNEDADYSKLEAKVSKITVKGGLVNLEGVDNLIQLIQTESARRSIDMAFRIMLVNVISFTEKIDCLAHFIQRRGMSILDEWVQELINKVNEINNKSAGECLLVLLSALDRLPVNLHALQTCNIGRSVNRLRYYKNPKVQQKSRSLVNKWKKRVEAEIQSQIRDIDVIRRQQFDQMINDFS